MTYQKLSLECSVSLRNPTDVRSLHKLKILPRLDVQAQFRNQTKFCATITGIDGHSLRYKNIGDTWLERSSSVSLKQNVKRYN